MLWLPFTLPPRWSPLPMLLLPPMLWLPITSPPRWSPLQQTVQQRLPSSAPQLAPPPAQSQSQVSEPSGVLPFTSPPQLLL